ncbi:MAG TPA: hypothetical protein VMD30_11750 [Tepidisphaeraceae bacterium]|nr:hypothetical protein [Tepidisphaeraceae bacterium]
MRKTSLALFLLCLPACQAPTASAPATSASPPPPVTVAPRRDEAFVYPASMAPLPNQQNFQLAYALARAPRIAVYVNRELDGHLIVPVSIHVLSAGEYDPAAAQSLDLSALENDLSDFLSCQGTVRVMTPQFLAAHMTPQDVQDLADGNPRVLSDLQDRTGAGILIQLQVYPMQQNDSTLDAVIVAEALDTQTLRQIASVQQPVSLPIGSTELYESCRSLADELMKQMAKTWNATPGR